MKNKAPFLILVITILINMNHGSLFAVTISLQEDLHLSKTSIGALGSCLYIGIAMGYLLAKFIMSKVNIKFLIGLMMSLNGISQIVFPLANGNLWVMCTSRLLSGFSQVFGQFAGNGLKSSNAMMTLVQMGVPVGVIFGYSFTAVFYYFLEWKWSFYIQGFSYFSLAIFFLCLAKRKVEIRNDEVETPQGQNQQDRKVIGKLACNMVFVFTLLTVSSLYFASTGINFWVSDYFLNVLNVPKKYIFPTFAIISATGPILGAIFGGIVTHTLGGCKTMSSMVFCLFVGVIAIICAIPAPFVRDFIIFISLLWITLFCMGAVMPNIMGVMISAVENEAKLIAEAVCVIANNLLGYLPAPFIYGVVCEHTGGNTSSYGLLVILYATIFAEIFMLCVLFAKSREKLKTS